MKTKEKDPVEKLDAIMFVLFPKKKDKKKEQKKKSTR